MKFRCIQKLLTTLSVVCLCFSVFTSVHAAPFTNEVNSHEILIFVSFSMPMNSLRAWSHQAQKLHAAVVIRGLVNDSFLDTEKAVKQMSGDQHSGVMIDPRLSQQYHITQVPAVVIRQKNNPVCLQNQSCWPQENFDVVLGDVGLENALQTMADRGDNTQTAQNLLAAWRST